MKSTPILFSGPMVRAILDGRKTQTRRVVNLQKYWSQKWAKHLIFCQDPDQYRVMEWRMDVNQPHNQELNVPFRHKNDPVTPWDRCAVDAMECPYGSPAWLRLPATQLWVKETFGLCSYHDVTAWDGGSIRGVEAAEIRTEYNVEYAADWHHRNQEACHWRPSIFMPRWASRLTLEVTGIRVERLQDISPVDALAEGCPHHRATGFSPQDAIDWYRATWESINGPGSWDAHPWVWVIEFRRIEAEKGVGV